jgi:hypothetical protein
VPAKVKSDLTSLSFALSSLARHFYTENIRARLCRPWGLDSESPFTLLNGLQEPLTVHLCSFYKVTRMSHGYSNAELVKANLGIARAMVSLSPADVLKFVPSRLSWLRPTLALPLMLAVPPFYNFMHHALSSPRTRKITFDVYITYSLYSLAQFSGLACAAGLRLNIACVMMLLVS